MKKTLLILFIACSFLTAAIPQNINYQGRITDADGVGVSDDLDLNFKLYDTPTLGTALWEEEHLEVPIEHGLFSIVLGSVNPLDIDFSEQLYLEITIDGEALTPRIALTSEAYSLYSAVADSIAGGKPDDDDISDDQLGEMGDVEVGTVEIGQTIIWDGAQWVPGEAGDEGAYNTDLTYNSASANLSITDGSGTLETSLNVREDSLQNNSIDDLNDVEIIDPDYFHTLVYHADRWTNRGNPYNTGLHFNHSTNTFTITDGLSTLETTINDENDNLTDNLLNDIGDVNVSSHPLAGRVLQYNGSEWIAGDVEAASDNQNDAEVFLTATHEFSVISDEVSVHGALDNLDEAIANLSDSDPVTTPISWYDISSIPSEIADGVPDYNTNLQFIDETDQLIITDGGGPLIALLDNEAEDLTDNNLNELADISDSPAIAGDIIQYDGAIWQPVRQTDSLVNLSSHDDFEILAGADNLHEALERLDNRIIRDFNNDEDTLADNEKISEFRFNDTTNVIRIIEGEETYTTTITGFTENGHSHDNLIDGDGIIGGSYDATSEIRFDINPGRGLEIFEDSIRLSDDYCNGSAFDGRFVNSTSTFTGDLDGSAPELTVVGIQGNPITDEAPVSGNLLSWDEVEGEWNYSSASLIWGDEGPYVHPNAAEISDLRIYDTGDTTMLSIAQDDMSMTDNWYGIKIRRTAHYNTKGHGIHSYAAAYDDLGTTPGISEFTGVYGQAEYGARNYGLYGVSTAIATGCEGYGVYGEGYTAGGKFYSENGYGITVDAVNKGSRFIGPEADGSKGTLEIASTEYPSYPMFIDGNEIDTSPPFRLRLQANYHGGVTINGPENDGTDAALSINDALLFDGDEIDAITGTLYLQKNSDDGVNLWGPENDGSNAALIINDYMHIDDNEIDNSAGVLNLQNNSGGGVRLWGPENNGTNAALIINDDLFIDGNEIDTPPDEPLYLQGNNAGGVVINGLDNDGTDAALQVVSSTYPDITMFIDGNEIDTSPGQSLYLQGNNEGGVTINGEGSNYNSIPPEQCPLKLISYSSYNGPFGHEIARLDTLSLDARHISSTGDFAIFTGDLAGVSLPIMLNSSTHVYGDLTKISGSFLIDHPDDPYNKTLRHNFVEAPVDLLIYSGEVLCDSEGIARVEMPDYYKSLVKEDESTFQLTPVGSPFMFGAEWDDDYLTLIIYGAPNRKINWNVYAKRDDPWIKYMADKRLIVEDKENSEHCGKGYLMNPEAYGQPKEKGWLYNKDKVHENGQNSGDTK